MRYIIFYPLLAFILLFGTTQAQFSIQKAVLEVYTGSWSQYSPDGFVKLDSLLATYPNAIAIQIHSGDSMTIPEEADLVNFYAPSYPQALINRSGTLHSRGAWADETGSVLAGASSVTVTFDSVTYNNNSRQLDVYLRALFTGPVSGDLRLNCVVTEDSVTGSGAGYDQANAYNTTPGHYYYGAGNPITGQPHRYVARAYLGGVWGTAGIIPASVVFGNQYSYHYTYTLPAHINPYRVSVVGMVSRYDGNNLPDRKILNAELWPYIAEEPATGIGKAATDDYESVSIYPNPAVGVFTIRTTHNGLLEILNITGQVVFTQPVKQGNNPLQAALVSGNYFVKLTTAHTVVVKPLVIAR